MENNISDMKYTVGTIFRLFRGSTANPTCEFIIVDRERMVNKRTNIHKDMYRIKYITSIYNKTEGWMSEGDIESMNVSCWKLEVHNG